MATGAGTGGGTAGDPGGRRPAADRGPPERGAPGSAEARLLAGAGRARETAAVLEALSGCDVEDERRGAPARAATLADLEELLLAGRPPEGLLVLDSPRVPDEDIGFVRRFLERHPGWRLLVLGGDERDARVRALLALPRASFLAWPPDLAELRTALESVASTAPDDAAPPPASSERRAPRGAAPASNGSVEVGALVEELLAGAALEGEDAPRYQFRAGAPQVVQRDRARLAEGLGGLVELARRCAGGDGLVRATVQARGGRVRVALDFPRGALTTTDLPAALGPDTGGDAEGEPLLAPARRAAALLRDLGAELELAPGEPGRLRCEVRLAPEPPVRRPTTPEDPFA